MYFYKKWVPRKPGAAMLPKSMEGNSNARSVGWNKHSPCLNERHGMESLAFEPADKGGVKPSLNAGSLAFKGGAAH